MIPVRIKPNRGFSIFLLGSIWRFFLLFSFYSASLIAISQVEAQTVPNTREKILANVEQMNSQQFDEWIKTESAKLRNEQARLEVNGKNTNDIEALRPTFLEKALMERLSMDKSVTDDSIFQVVDAWSRYEGSKPSGYFRTANGEYFFHTRRLINSILQLLPNRIDLQTKMAERQASLFNSIGQKEKAIEEYKKAYTALKSTKFDIDSRLQNLIINMASVQLSLDKKEEADTLFVEAAGYPWYKAPAPYMQDFRALYVTAVRGLITARRGNRKALKLILLAPAVENELGPELKKALEEVGGP